MSPTELESVIIKHPGVVDVAVTGIPDEECGDLPVAVVIAKDDSKVTALDIKDLVKSTYSPENDKKQLKIITIVLVDKNLHLSFNVDLIVDLPPAVLNYIYIA